MAKRSYGQHGGVARAVGILGERWALLIVRDLLLGPQRFTDLHRSLARIPSNVLTSRLRELEAAGVIERSTLPMPDTAVVYRLTEYGQQLEHIVRQLGAWGAQRLAEPRPGDVMALSALTLALQANFDRAAARHVTANFELHNGDQVIFARVDAGELEISSEPPPHVDVVVVVEPAFLGVIAGIITLGQAQRRGAIKARGSAEQFAVFAAVFGLVTPETPH